MENNKVKTPSELLASRSWTEFLNSLPETTTKWRIESYRDFVSLRTTASILTKNTERVYSLKQNKEDNTVYEITVTAK